jgi:hypothetical protein
MIRQAGLIRRETDTTKPDKNKQKYLSLSGIGDYGVISLPSADYENTHWRNPAFPP